MSDETTTEQLADTSGRDIVRGLVLQVADLIEREEAEPQAEPEPQPIQVCEGRWRTRNGLVKDVTAMPTDHEDFSPVYPWWDGVNTWRNDGRWLAGGSTMDLVEYLGPIEPQPEPVQVPEPQAADTVATGYTPPDGWRVLAVGERLRDGDVTVRRDGYQYPTERVGGWVGSNQRYIRPIEPEPQPEAQPGSDTELQAQVAFLKGREVTLGTRLQQEREVTTRLRGDLELVQKLLGTEKRRVTQLEELVASLRTINEGAEKAVSGAGVVNDSLRLQLAAVKAELASVAADRQRLQIELDAAHQVPADSPELRQLRADLAEVIQDRDTYRHAHESLLNDVNATHQRTKVMTIEAIVEWLMPIRTCGSQALATAVISNLPSIMRHLTGLNDEEIE